MTPVEQQQPINVLAPFGTKSAQIVNLEVDQITFSDGTIINSATVANQPGEPLTSPVDCGTF